MMAITVRSNYSILLSRLKSLVILQRCNHTFREDADVQTPQFRRDIATVLIDEQGYVDPINWKKVDSRKYGISRSMVSSPSWVVLKVLQTAGFEAYLVGGCVRDLLLNKIPKDFDVITSANLNQIRKRFARAQIVGRRFPICIVHVKGSIIEVSSFHTVAVHANGNERKNISPRFPQGCEEKDKIRWRDSMRRDFTVNSLFFDPFVNKIYDYANGMKDLKSLQLRTIIPAQVSFREDCARILRGLRIAARLGLTISNDTITAIRILSPSIERLPTTRIMMELNYMLSYGAGEPSLRLLNNFKLLEYMLPFHAAYLDQLAKEHSSERSVMLMKLFSNLDKMVTCDQPASCCLWVGLLAFHMALVNKPRDPLVVWTFASILYHGSWENGVSFARENVQNQLNFTPEICEPCDYESDTKLLRKVTGFASQVQASVEPLIERGSLFDSMSRFPNAPCSGFVFVPRQTGSDAAHLFNLHEIESRKYGRRFFKINHDLLKKGDRYETQFAIGKVIMDTMSNEIIQGAKHDDAKEVNHLNLSDVFKDQIISPEKNKLDQIIVSTDKKQSHSQSNPELLVNWQKIVENNNILQQYEVSISEWKADNTIKLSQAERTTTMKKVQKKQLHAHPLEKTEKQKMVEKESEENVKYPFVSEKEKENISQDGTTTVENAQEKHLPAQPHEKFEKQKRVRKKKSKDNVKKDVFDSENVKEYTSQDGTTTSEDAEKKHLLPQPHEKCEEQKIVGKKKSKDDIEKDAFVSEKEKENISPDGTTTMEKTQEKHLPAQPHEKCEKQKRVGKKRIKDNVKKDGFGNDKVEENTSHDELEDPQKKHLPAQPHEKCVKQNIVGKKKSKDNVKKDVFVSEEVKENNAQDGTAKMENAGKKHLPAQTHEKCEQQKKGKGNVNKDVFVSEKVKENTSQDGKTATTRTTRRRNQPKVNAKCNIAVKLDQEVELAGKKRSFKEFRVKNEKNKDPVRETNKENNHKLLSSLFK